MRKSCLTCEHERGRVKSEHEAECTLFDECMGLEKWCPRGCLRVWDESPGAGIKERFNNFCRYCGLEFESEICLERNKEGLECSVPVGCLLVIDEKIGSRV